jgi:hypothetical protein
MSNQAKEYDELALVTLSLWYESRKTSLGYLISDNFLCNQNAVKHALAVTSIKQSSVKDHFFLIAVSVLYKNIEKNMSFYKIQ